MTAEEVLDVIAEAIRDPRLDNKHRRILVDLWGLRDRDTGVIAPRADLVAKTSGFSLGGTRSALSRLAQLGYLHSSRRAPGPGMRAIAHYEFRSPFTSGHPLSERSGAWDTRAVLAKVPLRRRLVAAFDCRCEYCGVRGDARGVYRQRGDAGRFLAITPWHVDRIIPGARGGSYIPVNVALSCAACNAAKSSDEFIGPVRSLSIMEGRVND